MNQVPHLPSIENPTTQTTCPRRLLIVVKKKQVIFGDMASDYVPYMNNSFFIKCGEAGTY